MSAHELTMQYDTNFEAKILICGVRLVSCHDCVSCALREINSPGRLDSTVVRQYHLPSAAPSSISGRGVSNFFFFFFWKEITFSFLIVISKSNGILTEIRKVIAYHINMT